jgi:hypothetical protein
MKKLKNFRPFIGDNFLCVVDGNIMILKYKILTDEFVVQKGMEFICYTWDDIEMMLPTPFVK